MRNQIFCLDALTGLQSVEAASIPLTLTSPPYGKLRHFGGHVWSFPDVASELYRVTSSGGVVVWVIADTIVKRSYTGDPFRQVLGFMDLGFCLYDVVYLRRSGQSWPAGGRYSLPVETAYVFTKGKPSTTRPIHDKPNKQAGKLGRFVRRQPDGSLRFAGRSKPVRQLGCRGAFWVHPSGQYSTTHDLYAFDHPALMSESIARDLILSWSRPGQVVLDPFLGAGTTSKMALLSDRCYLGFEPYERYFRIAERRMAEAYRAYRGMIRQWLLA